eukprot:3099628-Pleurochrysis_carterae.AAC.1
MITGLDNAEEYTASADQITSRATGLLSESVAWVEIDDDGRKSVMQVRVLKCRDGRQPFAFSWLGLTWETYQRMTGGLCPTTPPMILPPELRPANQRRLDEFERLYRELKAEEASNAAAEPSGAADEDADAASAARDVAAEITTTAPSAAEGGADAATAALDVAAEISTAAPMATDENADATTTALDVAAEAIAAAPDAADGNADVATAAPDTAAETAVAVPSAADENADATNIALDVAANINSAAPSAAEDAGVSAKTTNVAVSTRCSRTSYRADPNDKHDAFCHGFLTI